MKATTLAKLEGFVRPFLTSGDPQKVVETYSKGRLDFLAELKEEVPTIAYTPPESLSRELWGIKFRSPIFNAAGMFKNGECYEMVARQGAGAYLGGTGTWNARRGNTWEKKDKDEKTGEERVVESIYLPFVPYPRSHSASNWLGLPNDGDEVNSLRAQQFKRLDGTRCCNLIVIWKKNKIICHFIDFETFVCQ